MPTLSSPQAQGAWVGLPCGLQRAIPGYEAVLAGHVTDRDQIAKSLIDLSPSSPVQYLSCSGVSGTPFMAVTGSKPALRDRNGPSDPCAGEIGARNGFGSLRRKAGQRWRRC